VSVKILTFSLILWLDLNKIKMITEEQKSSLIKLISDIDTTKNYWFIRTMGGSYFDDFVSGGYVAIGYNEILKRDLQDLSTHEDMSRDAIKEKLSARRPDISPSQTAKGAGQILKFYREMKQGDIVMIPGNESKEFALGLVESDMYEEGNVDTAHCQFYKRRRVKWHRHCGREDLDARLLLGLSNQQTMSNIGKYAEYIDRKLHKLYTKGDKTYLTLRVKQERGVSWDDYLFLNDLGQIVTDLAEDCGLDFDLKQIEMKINVQSPGDIMLMCNASSGVMLAFVGLIIIVGLGGGSIGPTGVKLNGLGSFLKDASSSFGDILKHISDYRNQSIERAERQNRFYQRLQNMDLEGGAIPTKQIEKDVIPSDDHDEHTKEPTADLQ
jgi:restriction system protein